MMPWGLAAPAPEPRSSRGEHQSRSGKGDQKREAFFLSSFRFHRASLLNSSGDMENTLEKSSADRCLWKGDTPRQLRDRGLGQAGPGD